MRLNKRRSGCPVSGTLDVLGDKWSLLIVRDMVFKQARYFKQFLAAGEGIATNILSDRLLKLEQSGIVSKQIDHDNRRQMIYSLT
ncbi:MAG: helix-turn-helix domain-containing protein [bacterium]|nr:transcriptional regulator [Gammaproteobacteria bacterium]HIL97662.1 transcriptional regulator [Pseudomonadales bacterium]